MRTRGPLEKKYAANGKCQDEPADREEKLNALGAQLKNSLGPIVERRDVKRDVMQDDGKDRDEPQAVDFGEVISGGSDAAKAAEPATQAAAATRCLGELFGRELSHPAGKDYRSWAVLTRATGE